MFRVGIIYRNGDIKSQNFDTFDEAETYILLESEKGIKRADILNQVTKERNTIWTE